MRQHRCRQSFTVVEGRPRGDWNANRVLAFDDIGRTAMRAERGSRPTARAKRGAMHLSPFWAAQPNEVKPALVK